MILAVIRIKVSQKFLPLLIPLGLILQLRSLYH